METEQFIKDAIEGGWKSGWVFRLETEIFLDPLAWQAVGKVRGWYVNTKCREDHSLKYEGTCMMFAWHHFIDHLADGKSIEDALAAIR